MITHADDLRHAPTAEQNYSESKWFCFYDPRLDLWVSSRIGLEPNRQQANQWLVVAHGGEVLCHRLCTGLELPRSDWSDISVAGLRYRTLTPMNSYGIDFEGAGVAGSFCWSASTPVFDYRDCEVPLPSSLAAEHYEQSGTISGSFTRNGETHPVEGIAHRDHSWGVRNWEGFRSWVAFMSCIAPGVFMHLERFDDDHSGTSVHGFISEAGVNYPVRTAAIDLEFAEDSLYPRGFVLNVEDVRGRAWPISGALRFTCPIEFGRCRVGESFGIFNLDGDPKAGIVEYGFTAEGR